MALWTRVQQLHGDALAQVGLVYNENFPIDVRCALAAWIEEQHWNELEPDHPQHDTYAAQLVTGLIAQLEQKIQTVEDFLMRIKLNEAANEFRIKYSSNPQMLVRIIKHCLQTEMRIIQQAEDYMRGLSNNLLKNPDPVQQINTMLDKLRQRAHENSEELRQMIQGQEAFVIQYQESAKRHAQLQQISNNSDLAAKIQKEKELYDQALRQKINELMHLRLKLLDAHQQMFIDISELQKQILDSELINWKRAQQLFGNGVDFQDNLQQIQEWCEGLADIIWSSRHQLRQLNELFNQLTLNMPVAVTEKLSLLINQVTSLLSALVTSTFIIEKQPPQVMKTNTRFTATVRLLVGGKLSVYLTPPQVKVTIISESQAISLLKNDKMAHGDASGEILNNVGTMEYLQANRQLSVNFRNMQLRKIKRAEKKGTESVMDEKFSLLFQSQFKVGGGELVFQVWTLSLPVVVIVHGNQEPHAWATVTWDNAFAEPGRVPFQVPEKVSWAEVAQVLSTKFKSSTGRKLMDENLQFLACKVFRTSQCPDVNAMVTWSQFCKETLPERSFTFWEWFFALMKITREHLRSLWNDGLILGFVGRHQAEDMLLKRCSGTFLLRFSDSELGGVTIAWVRDSQQREGQEVFMIQPFTNRDFVIRSLADRISDLKNLLYLYPDIPKEQAFGKYYTPYSENPPPSSNGYVRPLLVTQIPGPLGFCGYDSYPGTPQSSIATNEGGYHDPHSSEMQASARYGDMDYDLLNNVEFAPDPEDPVDFSNINVSDLVSYDQST